MTPFEAWCPRCKVTWPPETRVCVHCGGRVAASRAQPGATLRSEPATAEPTPPQPADADELARPPVVRPMRIGIALLWLVVALASAVAQHCRGS
jgi:hypothetical protein